MPVPEGRAALASTRRIGRSRERLTAGRFRPPDPARTAPAQMAARMALARMAARMALARMAAAWMAADRMAADRMAADRGGPRGRD
jgi:hypothetical protein